MGVGGGAWYPPAQASVADRVSTRRSYLVPFSGYVAMTIYAVGLVIDQAFKEGFRLKNLVESDDRERTSTEKEGEPEEQQSVNDEKIALESSVEEVKSELNECLML